MFISDEWLKKPAFFFNLSSRECWIIFLRFTMFPCDLGMTNINRGGPFDLIFSVIKLLENKAGFFERCFYDCANRARKIRTSFMLRAADADTDKPFSFCWGCLGAKVSSTTALTSGISLSWKS
jgi:hypothetical protein